MTKSPLTGGRAALAGLCALGLSSVASAATDTVYLNVDNITVEVGAGTSPGTFNNTFNGGATILKVIDAPSADAEEFHDQATHIWYTASATGGGLELRFDFFERYDIQTLHFWNYTSEGYDVDLVDFSFFDAGGSFVGALSVQPALGSSPGIRAQDIQLPAPLGVRYVTAFLSGSNREVDFQNIGFTALVSAPIPEPASVGLMALGLSGLLWRTRRRARD
jgi:hypothetical protein